MNEKYNSPIHSLFTGRGTSGFSVAQQLSNFKSITDEAAKRQIPIWVCTTQPRNFSDPAQIAVQRAVRDSILAIYGPHALDFWSGLTQDSTGFIQAQYDSGDGIHLNDSGHRLLFERVVNKRLDVLCR